MTPGGWHPDPAGAAGRLRWWDGTAWTDIVHDQPAPPAPAAGSPLDAGVLVFGAPRPATPGCRVFELTDGSGGRLGRLVETTRGINDSALGAALSRSKSFQNATTRELRGAGGYPELIVVWGPSMPGVVVATLPDRREVGRLVREEAGWALLGHDGRQLGTATSGGLSAPDGNPLSEVAPDGGGGWRAAVQGGPHEEPLRSMVVAAAVSADVLAS